MNIIDEIKARAKKNIKKIVLPEASDIRVLLASSKVVSEGFADVILVGNDEEINLLATNNNINLEGVEIINPNTFSDTEKYINDFYELRKNKGMTLDKARDIIKNNTIYFGNMLVYEGYADGLVCGSICTTADTLRPALQIIKTKEEVKVASSFFLMELPDEEYGYNGKFIYSDCGMIQSPTSEELVEIAVSSAKTFELLLNSNPNIAFLSHSTFGSSICPDQEKVAKAVSMTKEKYPSLNVDGEMQFDAAIVKEVAKSKAPGSTVAGRANTLIFPDLDAGNIGYKITQRLGHAKAYGPVTQGLKKPVNDLSRGCSSDDIVGVVAITALQANSDV